MSQNFSVAAAQRTGTFSTGDFTYNGGAHSIFWNWNIPNTAEYENTANHIQTNLFVNGSLWGGGPQSQWDGGLQVGKNGGPNDPSPAVQIDISGVPVGATVRLDAVITGTFTVGISNGLIS